MKNDTDKNKLKMIEALERSLGIVTPACKEVGVSRNTFYTWYKDDLEFRAAVDDINEITLDFAENQLLKKIQEGSERSILFYMRYKARRRGYSDSIDLTSGGEKLNSDIKVVFIDGNKGDASPEKDD